MGRNRMTRRTNRRAYSRAGRPGRIAVPPSPVRPGRVRARRPRTRAARPHARRAAGARDAAAGRRRQTAAGSKPPPPIPFPPGGRLRPDGSRGKTADAGRPSRTHRDRGGTSPRRRRVPNNHRPRTFVRTLTGALATLLLIAAIGVAAAAVITTVQTGMDLTRLPAVPVTGPPEGELPFRPVQFPSREDGVRLRGWYIPAPAGDGPAKDIIFIHDRGGNRLQEHLPAVALAEAFAAEGYGVLMYDSRAHGNSGGVSYTLGMHEIRDVGGAVDFLKGLREGRGEGEPGEGGPDGAIAVLGHGTGAVTAIRAAARMGEIDAVIADSPFADLSEHVQRNIDGWTGLPAIPFRAITTRLLRSFTNVDFGDVSPVGDMAAMTTPAMIIHGLDDEVIPHEDSLKLARVAAGPVDLWLVPGAGHQEAFPLERDTYVKRVLDFLAAAAPGSF